MSSEKIDFQKKYQDYTFKGKRRGESVILMLRRHWLAALFEFLPVLFFFLGIIFLHFFILGQNALFPIGINPNLSGLIETFLILILWLAIFVVWVDYYLDVWIITDQRIVNIEQYGFFRRHVSELEHGKIQDVTTEVQGIFPTLLNFGYVYIQTAGEKERFVFKQIPNPTRVRKIIMQLQKYAIFEEKKKEGEILRGKV
ncbi:MAG: PH domain-containing protein [Candidatus Moranbacteria bacterium]|jgi:hypothetical protein|nr:PH domain-containing protein [Candidatus Moranbacteria bacterium]